MTDVELYQVGYDFVLVIEHFVVHMVRHHLILQLSSIISSFRIGELLVNVRAF